MKHLLTLATGLAIVGSLLTSSVDLHGQGMLDRIKTRAAEAAKRKAEERAATKAAEATDRALDIAECTIAGNCPAKVPGRTMTLCPASACYSRKTSCWTR